MIKNKIVRFTLSLLVIIFMFGCASSEDERQKRTEEENKLIDEMNVSGYPEGDGQLEKLSGSKGMESEIVRTAGYSVKDGGTDKSLTSEKRKDTEIKRIRPFYKDKIAEAEEKKIPITVNFDATPIANVVRAFSTILKFDYIMDPQVVGNITISVNNSKMTTLEVWEMFEHILWLSGAYISPEGEILHVFPFAKMPQEKKILVDHKPQLNVEVMMFPIRNAASKDILGKLQPFLTPGSTAIDIPHQNSILLIETPSNSSKIMGLVELLDKKNKANWPQTVIKCSNVSSARIKNELLSVLPILGFPVSAENVQFEPGAIQITSLDRLQVILATAANVDALNELNKWVGILDKSDVGEQEQVFVYKVINGKADELLSAISVIFPTEGATLALTSSGSTGSTTSNTSSTTDTSLSSSSGGSSLTSTTTAVKSAGGSSNTDKDDGPASVFDVPVKVFADAVNNRLVVRTTPRTYVMLRAILERLDTVAAQVLLQVTVSEVTLTKDTEFGVEFSTKTNKGAYDNIFANNFDDLNPTSTTDYGLKYWAFRDSDPDNKFAYLRALAGDGKIKVLSCPQIVVKSHSEAKISVGESVPIVTSENTDTSSNTVINRSIEYQDTGIILTVTPHVSEGGLITIELEQNVSVAFPNNTSDIDSPIIQERVIKTALAIRDGGTIIVGGLIQERNEDSNSSYPFLQEIPLIRKLVGYNDMSSTRTEMIVLITGRVINERSRLDDVTRKYREAIKALSDMEEKK